MQQALANMNAELSSLRSLSSTLTSNEAILLSSLQQASQLIENVKTREPPDIDEVLVAPTVVGGQLYELVAEERAVEEARWVLGRALDNGKIGVAEWMRASRSLAREGFLKKALIKKVAKGMGLTMEREGPMGDGMEARR